MASMLNPNGPTTVRDLPDEEDGSTFHPFPSPPVSAEQLAWQRACALVADQVGTQRHCEPQRLAKGLALAQAGQVTLISGQDQVEALEDVYATVSSGRTRYRITNDGICECPDYGKSPTVMCKHLIALELHQEATVLLERQRIDGKPSPMPSTVDQGAVPRRCHVENPAGANFKARIGNAELWYTWHGETDEEVLERMRTCLPTLQAILTACETQHADREAAAQAQRQAEARDLAAKTAADDDARTRTVPAPTLTPSHDTDRSWCPHHHLTMSLHTNDRGSWYSHVEGTLPNGKPRYCRGD